MGHDLNDCRVLGNFSFSSGTDKEHDVYSYSHQGHEINGDYIYFYEGNAVENSDDPGTINRRPMSPCSTTTAESSYHAPR